MRGLFQICGAEKLMTPLLYSFEKKQSKAKQKLRGPAIKLEQIKEVFYTLIF